MSAGQTLRVLVTARLSAAAEEIFALFERTIAEYEEELRLCKEKQRRQEQLETLRPRVMLLRADAQSPSRSPGLDLDQKIPETPQIKEEPEEQSIKQEQEQLPEPVPESNALYLKTEEPSLIQQTELREETQGEDFSTETYFLSDTEEDMGNFSDFNHVENHMDSFSCSAAQMEAEAVVDHYHQVQIRTRETTTQNCGTHLYLDNRPETSASVNTGHMRGTVRGAQGKGFQCPFCEKVMKNRYKLKRHIVVHTGERPFSCSTCGKSFTQKSSRDVHERLHTGERQFTCSICNSSFKRKCDLKHHKLTHSLDRPFFGV
ncbi:unnamed protein product [Knipowitschia caucasica]